MVSTQSKVLSSRKKLTMAVITIILMSFGAEIAARMILRYRKEDQVGLILSPHNPGMQIEGRYVSHPFLPFALRPNRKDTIFWTPPPWPEVKGSREPQVWHIKTNSWGFRGREVSMEKPPNSIRVICLGGSTTYDTITDGKTWPEKLEVLLQRAHPARNVQVLNFGMNAASLPFNIVQLALLGVHFGPDLVIVYAGHNDLWSGIGLQGFRPDYSHRLGHWDDSRVTIQRYIPRWAMKSAFVTGLAVAFDRSRGIDYDLVRQIFRPAPPSKDPLEGSWAFQKGLVTIQGIARAHGAKLLVITPYYAFRKNDRKSTFIEKIKDAARQAGIPLLDAANQLPVGDSSLVVDDVHFSDKGGTLFSRKVADAIKAYRLLDD